MQAEIAFGGVYEEGGGVEAVGVDAFFLVFGEGGLADFGVACAVVEVVVGVGLVGPGIWEASVAALVKEDCFMAGVVEDVALDGAGDGSFAEFKVGWGN